MSSDEITLKYFQTSNEKTNEHCRNEAEQKEIPSEMVLSSHTEEEKRNEKRRLIVHLLLLYAIGNLNFSSFLGLTNATTSLLPEDNLGIIGLTVSNITEMILALFLVAWLNRIMGVKKVLTLGVFVGILYPLSFFYPVSYIFILGSISRGTGIVLVMSSIYIYGSKLVYQYHKLVGGNLTVLMVVMSGVTAGSVGGGYLFGNILEYGILHHKIIANISETDKSICGADYCNHDLSNLTTVQPPPSYKYYTLIGIYSGITLLASILCLCLEGLPSEPKESTVFKEFSDAIKMTFRQLLDPRGYLLILITMLIGAKEAFVVTVFTYAYINCTLGIAHIGKIMMVYGVFQILMCCCNWLPVRIIKRVPTLALGCLMLIGCYMTLLFFPLSATKYLNTIYGVLVSVYAISASIITTTTMSMYALMFPDDVGESFGVACFWITAGAMICNATNRLFCVSVKLYLLTGIAVLSFVLFSYLEYLIHTGKFSSYNTKQN